MGEKMEETENIKLQNGSPVLFIIGNGFDLGLNMKTKYEDVYESYVKTSSNSDVIRTFKRALQKRTPYDKWSDFEMGMAEYAKTLTNEAELIECVRDFKRHMVEHLRDENQRVIELIRNSDYSDGLLIIKELNNSFKNFYSCFSPNLIRQLDSINGGHINPRIITFNYTTILDELLNLKTRYAAKDVGKPLHIHGSLDNDVVLGVNDIDQLHGTRYSISKRGSRAFVKTVFNQQYDFQRVSEARQMISNSQIICTYGFSMGKSDRTWVSLLIEWLKKDSNHHLIVYQYDETEWPRYNFDALMDAEEEEKETLGKRLNLTDERILDQVHIPVGYDIFNFKFMDAQMIGAITATPPYNNF